MLPRVRRPSGIPQSDRLRILHVVLTLDIGGLENGVVNLVNGLPYGRFQSLICCIKHSGDLASRIDTERTRIIELQHYGAFSLKLAWRLYRLIRNEGISIVHTRNLKPFLLTFMSAKLCPGVAIVHSEHGKDYPFDRRKMLLQKLMSHNTDAIIALSCDIKYCLKKYVGIDERNITLIMNGVNTDNFAPNDKYLLKRQLGFSRNELLIGAVGRLVEVKNYEELIAAFYEIRRRYRTAYLIIVGDGPLFGTLSNYVTTLGLDDSVRLLGSRDDVPRILGALDIFASTSKNEGISNTILEAMSCGLPVVVSDVGGNPEIVPNANVGQLYSAGNTESLISALGRLMDDEAERVRLGSNARTFVESEFSLISMIKKYSDIYERVEK